MNKDYYIFKSGELIRKDFNIVFINDEQKTVLPIKTIDNIFIYGHININSDCINYLGKLTINVHFFDHYGNFRSSLTGVGLQHSGNTHINQAIHYIDYEKRCYIAKQFIKSAIWHMNKNLMEYNIAEDTTITLDNLDRCKTIEEIMGIEGSFRKKYYGKLDIILKYFKFECRTKRPPQNEINAMISFGNSLCYNYCLNAIKQTYLNSTISFLHECGDRRHSLCLDISEIFKPIIIDRTIFKLINNKIINKSDFRKEPTFCYLTDSGKKKFIQELDSKLDTTFLYRKIEKNCSYRNLIKLESYKLCKHILDIEKYESLKMDW
jgi:CRISP-associated protein Cas1